MITDKKDRLAQIKEMVAESVAVKNALLGAEAGFIEKAAAIITKSLKAGGKLLIFGNGGSAADSQHMAAELIGRFKKERKGLPAIALSTDTSILTALANDYGYESVFKRQVEALGKKGDAALGISTSGNSRNVIEAVKQARRMGLSTIALTGSGGGRLKSECDTAITVDSKDTARIQESHILIAHILCQLVEDEF